MAHLVLMKELNIMFEGFAGVGAGDKLGWVEVAFRVFSVHIGWRSYCAYKSKAGVM